MLTCAFCGHTHLRIFVQRDAKTRNPLPLGFCCGCGLMQQTKIPIDLHLTEYYSHNYRKDYKQTLTPKLRHVWRAGNAAISRIEFLQKALSNYFGDTTLVDVGAGGGEFVYLAKKFGFQARGIEPNIGYSDFARDNYGVEVLTKAIDSLEPKSADVITLFHVLEHLPSPAIAARILYLALRDEGFLFIEVPNILQADASPANIFFRAHLFYFSKSTLCHIMDTYFELVHFSEKGNLKIVFKKRRLPLSGKSLAVSDADRDWFRFSRKGWLQYLTSGGGWKKPLFKLRNSLKELCLFGLEPKEILDSIFLIHLNLDNCDSLRLQKRMKLMKIFMFTAVIIAVFSIFLVRQL